MIFPIGSRTNTRYRGPLESRKSDAFNKEQTANIKLLYTTLSGFESQVQNIIKSVDNTQRTNIDFNLKKLNEKLLIIRGEI